MILFMQPPPKPLRQTLSSNTWTGCPLLLQTYGSGTGQCTGASEYKNEEYATSMGKAQAVYLFSAALLPTPEHYRTAVERNESKMAEC